MKKIIPLWLKCPAAVLLSQFGRLPFRVVLQNMRWSFTQSRNSSDAVKDKVYARKQQTVYKYLVRKYGDCIDKIGASGTHGEPVANAPIWIFWWQGIEEAPYIIQTCLMNIRKNAGEHPVCILDSDNYRQYAEIPEHIEAKMRSGMMSMTHFSDYLRMNLLARYGGLWIDGAIFVKEEIDPSVFEKSLWTLRNPGRDRSNISNWKWTIGVLGGWKGHVLFRSVSEVLSRYWSEHDMVADYFMMDCIMKIVYDRNLTVKSDIDAVLPNNRDFYWLQENANSELDTVAYQNALKGETWLYKISWKGKYALQTAAGKETVYAQWKREFGVQN